MCHSNACLAKTKDCTAETNLCTPTSCGVKAATAEGRVTAMENASQVIDLAWRNAIDNGIRTTKHKYEMVSPKVKPNPGSPRFRDLMAISSLTAVNLVEDATVVEVRALGVEPAAEHVVDRE